MAHGNTRSHRLSSGYPSCTALPKACDGLWIISKMPKMSTRTWYHVYVNPYRPRQQFVAKLQVTVSRTANTVESNGYVWSVTFDTPTTVGGTTNAGDQPAFHANGRMLGNTSSSSYLRLEVRRIPSSCLHDRRDCENHAPVVEERGGKMKYPLLRKSNILRNPEIV